jgi:hypothetical protein
MLPISTVEGIGFITLFKVMLGDNFKLPCRGTVINLLGKIKEQGLDHLQKALEKVDFVNLTTDAWTSRVQESYMTATCHYI